MQRYCLFMLAPIASCAIFAGSAAAQLEFSTGFEQPVYTSGTVVGQDSWASTTSAAVRVRTAAEISAEMSAAGLNPAQPVRSGDQALFVTGPQGGSSSVRPIPGFEIEQRVIVDVWARPLMFGASSGSTVGGQAGQIGNVFFVLEDHTGSSTTGRAAGVRFGTRVAVPTSFEDLSIDYGSDLPAGGGQLWKPTEVYWDGDTWFQITMDVNYLSKTWDFFINGNQMNAEPIPFWSPTSQDFAQLRIFRGSGQPGMIVDDLTVSTAAAPGVWNVNAGGNWSDGGNWTGAAVPNAVGAPAAFGPVINDNRTVTVDIPVTVGLLNFNNANRYTLSGAGPITIDGAPNRINVQAGSHTISAALNLQADTTVNVGPAGSTLTVSNLQPTSVNLTKEGAGMLEVNALVGGDTNVAGGSLKVLGGDLAQVNALVASGRAGGTWDGPGINSSTAAAQAGRALGVAPDGSDVLVRLTFGGDANVDGQVTIADLGILAANWQSTNAFWHLGDFNYDGSVTIADLGILAANWQQGVAAGSEMSFAEALAMFDVFNGIEVPEPSSALLLGLGAAGLLVRRRRIR